MYKVSGKTIVLSNEFQECLKIASCHGSSNSTAVTCYQLDRVSDRMDQLLSLVRSPSSDSRMSITTSSRSASPFRSREHVGNDSSIERQLPQHLQEGERSSSGPCSSPSQAKHGLPQTAAPSSFLLLPRHPVHPDTSHQCGGLGAGQQLNRLIVGLAEQNFICEDIRTLNPRT
eukprot:747418-Hanusia_phi.AAC.1